MSKAGRQSGAKELNTEEIVEELKKPIFYEYLGNEKEFEDDIFEHIEDICDGFDLPPVLCKTRQKLIQTSGFMIKPDIIVRHDDGSCTIFEVKKANMKYPSTGTAGQMNGIGQLLLYGNVIEAIIGIKPRLVLIDNKIYFRTYCAFLGNNLPIALVDFQKDRVFVPYNGWRYG